ncbi:MAG: isocitrate lyase/phosphoenolpyruvate mutase family protein [Sneathiellales bacterium]|nr:isocitrate lyase/phosphoenolpyruvate mutase family protein [Sneathiellales bacterium]
MTDMSNKSRDFAALHKRGTAFFLPNPWDVGSTKMVTALGAEALATTSAGYAFSNGKTSAVGEINREEALTHAEELVKATHLPVSADLENGYGKDPEAVAKTIERAIEIGLAGCTIEDTSGDEDNPLYDASLAIERIAAASETARKLDPDFMLTARSENYLFGRSDLDDTLHRLLGYQNVGADVLYAPGLPDLATIKQVCDAVERPVNVVAGIGLKGVTMQELQECGVTRVSAGSALSRVAFGAMTQSMKEILETGSFDSFQKAASFSSLDKLIQKAELVQK